MLRPCLTLGLTLGLTTLGGCATFTPVGRRPAAPAGFASSNRTDPALSGDGRWLASVIEQGGTSRVILQSQPGGALQPLRHLRRQTPHVSPSLSWNGRYLAALVTLGDRRLIVVEDRLRGGLLRLPLPGGSQPERLSLAPDGSRLAVQLQLQGRRQVQLFSLSALLEPDRPGGIRELGGGTAP
ncbi:MAG: Tol biopolymer transporter periplasmic protein [Cyanobium sp.]|nr:Tol biopolymer transporter periplasmic protein [Cyanobium sp.]